MRKDTKGLGGPYIHIDREATPEHLEEIKRFLEVISKEYLTDKFQQDISIEVEVIEGSIKARVMYAGMALVTAISAYGGFRSGIDALVKDLKWVSSSVINDLKQKECILDSEIIYKARRQGIPGKVQRYCKKLDKLADPNVNANQRKAMIVELKKELLAITKELTADEDKQLLLDNSPKEIADSVVKQLPDLVAKEPIIDTQAIKKNRAMKRALEIAARTVPDIPKLPDRTPPAVTPLLGITRRKED